VRGGSGIEALPRALKPLVAVPATVGTGSESPPLDTTHVVDQHVTACLSRRLLRPALGIFDPLSN
jgi:alcohol dehydrogenase class IV